jgi:diacylglycerol kinase (ATP)
VRIPSTKLPTTRRGYSDYDEPFTHHPARSHARLAPVNMPPASQTKPRRVLVLFNPRAGRAKARDLPDELVERLTRTGLLGEAVSDLAHACGEANRLHAAGELRAIVAAGGDGTIAEIVNRTDPGVPITTLPLGTENLLARHFGITNDVDAVAEMIVRRESVQLDVGRARTAAGERLFLLMASAGLDAEIVRRLHDARRGNISHWTYISPILAAAAHYEYPIVRISSPAESDDATDGMNFKAAASASQARWVVAFNLPCYAGMLPFLPDRAAKRTTPGQPSAGADGQLDLCRFDHGSFWHTLYYYVWLLLRRADRIATRHVEQLTHFRLEAANTNEQVPLQIDGDPAGYLPAEIDIIPGRLNLLIPASASNQQ